MFGIMAADGVRAVRLVAVGGPIGHMAIGRDPVSGELIAYLPDVYAHRTGMIAVHAVPATMAGVVDAARSEGRYAAGGAL